MNLISEILIRTLVDLVTTSWIVIVPHAIVIITLIVSLINALNGRNQTKNAQQQTKIAKMQAEIALRIYQDNLRAKIDLRQSERAILIYNYSSDRTAKNVRLYLDNKEFKKSLWYDPVWEFKDSYQIGPNCSDDDSAYHLILNDTKPLPRIARVTWTDDSDIMGSCEIQLEPYGRD